MGIVGAIIIARWSWTLLATTGRILLDADPSTATTSAVPAAIDDRKKLIGMTGDHHCGASMFGISKYKEPSELWCMVDNVTAAMASITG